MGLRSGAEESGSLGLNPGSTTCYELIILRPLEPQFPIPHPHREVLDSEVTMARRRCGRRPSSRVMILFRDQKLQGQM